MTAVERSTANSRGEPTFIDTNILVYATVPESPLHISARGALQELETTCTPGWISRQVLREYLAVLSRPQAFAQPVNAAALVDAIHDFQRRFSIAEDTALVTAQLLYLVRSVPVGGKQVHDANIVATMQVYGIRRLLTYNGTDFARFGTAVTLVEPAQGKSGGVDP